ncbi:MAG TPA: site-2 protease family protein [Rhizomicrobium sp.]|nr:site-2 protease family protein [Rhizomicrobium sp.]
MAMNAFFRTIAYCLLGLPGLLVMQQGSELSAYGGWGRPFFLLLYAMVLFIVVTVHEGGHALAVRHFGWKITLFAVFPIAYRTKTKRFELWTLPSGDLGGAVTFSTGNRIRTPGQSAVLAAAGPLANLALAFAALALTYLLPDLGPVTGGIAVASLFVGLGNLLPWQSRGGAKSDGAVLLSAIKKRRRAARFP